MGAPDMLNYDVEEIVKGDKEYLWHHIKPHKLFETAEQLIMVEGKGLTVTDIRGREFLDVTSGGVWSVIVGFGRESIGDAIAAQLKKLPYFAGVYGTVPAVQCAEKILATLPRLGKIYFANSGSEANEKAFKIVRQAAHFIEQRKGKFKLLYRNRDYHGTTIAAVSASGQNERKEQFGPFVEGFVEFPHCCCYRCPFDKTYPGCDIECARCIEDVVQKEGPETVGGLIIEPITAGGGIIVPVPEYFPIVQDICKKHDIWLIMDEVVCGFGRTGTFWGHDHFDVDPDMVTMAKGMASSYEPLSAVAVKQEIFDLFLNDPADPDQRMNFFRDISTYGGCTGPLVAALETMRIIEDEKLIENSKEMGSYLLGRLQELKDLPLVGDVRGMGLFCGVEFVRDKTTREPVSEAEMAKIVGSMLAQNIIVGRTNTSITGLNVTMNFAPALIITKDEVDRVVDALRYTVEAGI